MDYINHYTLNTGNNRRSIPDDVDRNMYFILKRLIREAENNGKADILDGAFMELTIEKSSYAITLFTEIDGDKVPFLMTCGCKDKKDAGSIIKEANNIYKNVYGNYAKAVPITPFCLDIVLPTIAEIPRVLEWTGDFCKCMAWAILAPEMIH